jgi:DNA-binding CsgD family transcriptional regulator
LIVLRLRQRARSQADQLGAQLQEIQFHKDRTVWAEREKTLREQIIQQQKALLAERIADAEHLQAQLEQLVQEQQQSRREEILAQYEKAKQEQAGIEILMSQFNTVYPGFASALRRQYSKLSLADVQLCTLIRMNLTTKEISLLLHIEPRSVYVKKYRIMEKMGLAEGDDFEQLIFSLDHDEPT